jgi:hypothetical protein
MQARRTIVNADVRIASFRQRVDALHLPPAPALGKFSEAGHRPSLKRHIGYPTGRRNQVHAAATDKPNFRSKDGIPKGLVYCFAQQQ